MVSEDPKIEEKKKSLTKGKITILIFLALSLIALFSLSTWLILKYDQVATQYGMDSFHYKNSNKGAIYSSDGILLTYIYELNKEHVPLEKIAKPMQEAIVAIEDHRFYNHSGVDLRGTLRALYRDIISGEMVEGGSTITQQLVRNLFLTPDKTIERKITEILLAINLENKFTKEEILEMYLNEIYFGNGCYGIEAAALKYFGKSASQLDLAESTMLAGVPKAPSYYDPLHHPKENRIRQQDTISRMIMLRYITPEEAQNVLVQKIIVKNQNITKQQAPYKYPYFTTEVVQQLIQMFGKEKVYNSGLKVITTLDSRAAIIAEQIAKSKVEQFKSRGISATNLSIVSVRVKDGAVISMIGGSDYSKDQNNLAVIPRQPGSAIKPLNYAGALEQGIINENSVINASSKSFGKYMVGSNTDATVSVCNALKYSMNVPAVEVLSKYGANNATENLRKFGITSISEKDANLALALGGMYQGIKPVELAAAYASFANAGLFNKHYIIQSVEDNVGNVLYRHEPENKQIISRKTAQIITQMLLEVVQGGTGTRANISGNEAGKTGTTNDSRCLWFVGFNKDIVTAVWIGNTNNAPVYGFHGGDLAAPIWREYTSTLINQKIIPKPIRIYDTNIPLSRTYIVHNQEDSDDEKDKKEEQKEASLQRQQTKVEDKPKSANPPQNKNVQGEKTPNIPKDITPLPEATPNVPLESTQTAGLEGN